MSFTYVSPKSGKQRTIGLNPQACLQARLVDGMPWNDIGRTGEHQDELERATRFGDNCNVANIMDVRPTEEWRAEVVKFAEEGGHDVEACLAKSMSAPRKTNGGVTQVAAAPATTTALPEVSASEIDVTLRKLERRAKETTLLRRLVAEELELKARHYAEEESLLTAHIDAVKTLQKELAELDAKSDEEAAEEAATKSDDAPPETDDDDDDTPPEDGGVPPETNDEEVPADPAEDGAETPSQDADNTPPEEGGAGLEDDEEEEEEVDEDVDEPATLLTDNMVEDNDEDVDETPPEVLVETADEDDDEEATLLTEVLDEEEEEEEEQTARHIALLKERMESTESPAVKEVLQQRIDELA